MSTEVVVTRPALSTSLSEEPRPHARPGLDASVQRDGRPRFERRTLLGIGGMGRVVLVHDRWLGRDVAVKEPTDDADTRRLWHEALVTARLEHPGIVPVYDLGTGDDERPWFAMRVVRGRSLADILAEPADLEARLALIRPLLAACEAVAYAHSRGVVHRDLKPANIMIGAFSETQIIDWGLALAPDIAGFEAPAGTPQTMSPEQARKEEVDARTDVWSLGAILWNVCGGHPAFPQPTAAEVLDAVRARRVPPLPDAVPRALAAVVMRAMEPERERRYADAGELAADLGRWLDGRRVSAHVYSTWELMRRVARAWRVPLAIAGVAAVAVIVAVAVSVASIAAERDHAEGNLALALVSEARRALRSDARGEAEVLARTALAHAADAPYDRAPAIAADARGVLLALGPVRPLRDVGGAPGCVATSVSGAKVLCSSVGELSLFSDGVPVWSESRRLRAAVLSGPDAFVLDGADIDRVALDSAAVTARWSLDCTAHALTAGGDPATTVVWGRECAAVIAGDRLYPLPRDGRDLVIVATSARLPSGDVRWAAIESDGSLVAGTLADDFPPTRFEAALGTAPDGPLPTTLAFVGPDLLFSGDAHGGLTRIALADPARHDTLPTGVGMIRSLRVAPDGRAVAIMGEVGGPLVAGIDALGQATSLGRLPDHAIRALAFEPDGRLRTVGEAIELWSFAGVRPHERLMPAGVLGLAISPDGSRLAVASGAAVALVDPGTRAAGPLIRWQDGVVKGIVFAPDGRLVAHGFGDGAVVVIGQAGPTERFTAPSKAWRRIVALADGTVLVAVYGAVIERFAIDGPPRITAAIALTDLAADPSGRELVGLTREQNLVCSDLAALDGPEPFRPCGRDVRAAAVARPDAARVFAAGTAGVSIVAAEDGRVLGHLDAPGAELDAVAAAPGIVAAGARDGSVWVWRDDLPVAWAVLREHDAVVSAIVIDPGGRWLAAGDWNGHLMFADLDWGIDAIPEADAEAAWGLDVLATFDPRAADRAAADE